MSHPGNEKFYEAMKEQMEYQEWLKELIKGNIKKKGIQNGKEQ